MKEVYKNGRWRVMQEDGKTGYVVVGNLGIVVSWLPTLDLACTYADERAKSDEPPKRSAFCWEK